jgi:hypothetical protein
MTRSGVGARRKREAEGAGSREDAVYDLIEGSWRVYRAALEDL